MHQVSGHSPVLVMMVVVVVVVVMMMMLILKAFIAAKHKLQDTLPIHTAGLSHSYPWFFPPPCSSPPFTSCRFFVARTGIVTLNLFSIEI